MTPGAGARDGEPAGTEALSRHLLRPVGAGRVGGIAVPVPRCRTGREWACMPKCTDLPFRAGELRVS